MSDVEIVVDGLPVDVPEEWLADGEEAAVARVRSLRAEYHVDRQKVGHEKAVENHVKRMKS